MIGEKAADLIRGARALPMVILGLAACSTSSPSDSGTDILATAADAGSFATLLVAVRQADLVETLTSPGPFTVFAPTDEAFAGLPPGILDKLLDPGNQDQLVQVLTYHVVPGKLAASDLAGRISTPTTVEGRRLQIDAIGPGLRVDDAEVIRADLEASNGIIHVIDTVLLPQ